MLTIKNILVRRPLYDLIMLTMKLHAESPACLTEEEWGLIASFAEKNDSDRVGYYLELAEEKDEHTWVENREDFETEEAYIAEQEFRNQEYKMIVALAPADVGAVQAQKIIINSKQNFLTKCQYNEYILDTHFQMGRDAVRGAVELRGNGELIKRQAIISINGWNEETITDDLDMSTRLHIKGWDIRFCSDTKVYEEGVISFTALIRQRRRWVEGSIRRYLEYMWDVFTSKDMSLRVGLDLIAYVTEFLLPFWLIAEIIIQAFHFVKGYQNSILSSIIVVTITGIFFTFGFIYSLRKIAKYDFIKSVWEAVITSIYFITIWFPIAMLIIFKIIFTKKTMDWGKTVHGVSNAASKEIN